VNGAKGKKNWKIADNRKNKLMPINMKLWQVKTKDLQEVTCEALNDEQRLQEWLAKDKTILGLDVLLVGRQVSTGNGSIDLLAIDGQANLVVLVLKRDKEPHELLAQTLDHASWVNELSYDQIDTITKGFTGKPLWQAFSDHFGVSIPKIVNEAHSMLILTSDLDDSSERIVNYLAAQHRVPIDVLFIALFKTATGEFLGRASD
jgi:hypothetical protein